MDEPRYLTRQNTLRLGPTLAFSIFLRQSINGLYRQKGEVFKEFVYIGIRCTQPKLIEGVR